MASLSLNGTTDFVRGVPAVLTYPLTLSCWFWITSLAANARTMGLFNSAGTSVFGQVITTTGALRTGAINNAGTVFNADTTNTTPINVWAHGLSIFASATSRKSILNGSLAGSAVNASAITPTAIDRLSFGAGDGSVMNLFFPGLIGPSAMWAIDLSDGEAVDLAAGMSPRKIQPGKLAYYSPYPGLGATMQDWFGRNGGLTGGASNANMPPMVRHA